ncbi:MAG: putative ATP-dependent endonuclease of the family [Planctomycetaceae bacterium]|nr:putative ATP-dependent endonuclease of the family [Planctomycetaceae bacterium]
MSPVNLRDPTGCSDASNSPNPVVDPNLSPVLIVVEGAHDVDFLRLLTARLHLEDPAIPYLGLLEQIGRVIFVPFGGGRVVSWSNRFAALKCHEFHVYDREIEPETAIRKEVVVLINRRPNCRALLLKKHSLENYLHSAAIFDAGGGRIQVSTDTRMSTDVARNGFLCRPHDREC